MNRLRFAVPKGLDLLKGSFTNVIQGPASSQNDRRQYNYNSPVHLRDPPLKIYESFSSLSNILGGIGQFCQVFRLSFATFFKVWVPSNAAELTPAIPIFVKDGCIWEGDGIALFPQTLLQPFQVWFTGKKVVHKIIGQ